MKKYIILFAMLMIVSIAMADNDPIQNPKDTVDITIADCSWFESYTNDSGQLVFSIRSYDDDSVYFVTLYVHAQFAEGNFPDTCIERDFTEIKNAEGNWIHLNNGLGEFVVTIDSTTNPYRVFNFKFPYVGVDSVLYNLDLTFNEPYEVSYEEVALDSVTIDTTSYPGAFLVRCYAGKYYYEDAYSYDTQNGLAGTYVINAEGDAQEFRDTTLENVFNVYRSTITFTKNGESIDFAAKILTYDNIVYYINCQKPTTAVEEIVLPSYNVFTEVNTIVVNGAEGQRAEIYDVTGRLVRSAQVTSDYARFAVGTGVYVVRVNGVATKVVVR